MLGEIRQEEFELNTRVKREMSRMQASSNIRIPMTKIGNAKDLVLPYFGPDGNRMYVT